MYVFWKWYIWLQYMLLFLGYWTSWTQIPHNWSIGTLELLGFMIKWLVNRLVSRQKMYPSKFELPIIQLRHSHSLVWSSLLSVFATPLFCFIALKNYCIRKKKETQMAPELDHENLYSFFSQRYSDTVLSVFDLFFVLLLSLARFPAPPSSLFPQTCGFLTASAANLAHTVCALA